MGWADAPEVGQPTQAGWMSAPVVDAPPAAPERSKTAQAVDVANAVGSGGNRGLLRLMGLPVDTAANVIDLGKAVVGGARSLLTDKSPPDWLSLQDRKNVVGSGDYLINRLQQSDAGRSVVDPRNPEYEGGYAQAIGSGLTNIANPASKAQAVNQALLGVTGNVAGKFVNDATGSTAGGITASMLPLLAQTATAGLGKRVIRGNEAGRQEMAQRIQDLKNAGVENPMLGLASGNTMIGGVENLLQNTPGAVGVMRRSRENALAGLENKALGAAETASPNRGALESGVGIISGIKGAKEAFKAAQGGLYDALDQHVPAGTPSGVNETMRTLADLNASIPGAPNTSKLFKNARIAGIEQALGADLTQGRAYSPSQLRDAVAQAPDGPASLNAALGEGKLPYEAVKKTRTLVGNEIADSSLMSDVPRSKWNPLYGALSSDLKDIAAQSGPEATSAFNRANSYTRAGLNRLERVAPFADVAAPEQAFTAANRSLGENVSTFQALKKTLPEGARGQIAGTVIERLGKATNGAQNEMGTVWSPETFLTNWNKMSDKGRNELFSGFGNAEQVKRDVEAVAKSTSMMRESSKLWANPSGSGANLFARGAMAAGAGAVLLNPWAPVAAGATIGGANLLARGLTSRNVVNAVAQKNTISPQLTQGQIQALIASGLLEENK